MKESLHITQPMSNPAFDWNRRDPLFEAVAHDVVEWQTVSVSTVCGQFHIEQNRAKRIVRQLEQAHIIGEQWSARHSREILCCCTRTLDQRLADLATVARLQPLGGSMAGGACEIRGEGTQRGGRRLLFQDRQQSSVKA